MQIQMGCSPTVSFLKRLDYDLLRVRYIVQSNRQPNRNNSDFLILNVRNFMKKEITVRLFVAENKNSM